MLFVCIMFSGERITHVHDMNKCIYTIISNPKRWIYKMGRSRQRIKNLECCLLAKIIPFKNYVEQRQPSYFQLFQLKKWLNIQWGKNYLIKTDFMHISSAAITCWKWQLADLWRVYFFTNSLDFEKGPLDD